LIIFKEKCFYIRIIYIIDYIIKVNWRKIYHMSEEELKIISSNTLQFTELNKINIQNKFYKLSVKKEK